MNRLTNHPQLMIKSLLISTTLLFLFGLYSCKKEVILPLSESAIAIIYKEDKPYLITQDQTLFDLSKYDEIEDNFDDYIKVKKDGLYGYIDKTGLEIIPPSYEDAMPMKEKKAVIRINNQYQIIDTTGKVLYTLPNNITSSSYFSNNHLVCELNNTFGYIVYNETDSTFKVQTPIKTTILNNVETQVFPYEYCGSYQENFGVVGSISLDPAQLKCYYTYLDLNGNQFFTNESQNPDIQTAWEYCGNFKEGYARVANTGTFHIYENIKDNFVSMDVETLLYQYISSTQDIYGNPVYLTDSDGTILKYPYAEDISDGTLLVANLGYFKSLDLYFRHYEYYNLTGDAFLKDAILYEPTGYPKVFMLTSLLSIKETMVFRRGGNTSSYKINYYYTKVTEEGNHYQFSDAIWDIPVTAQWFIDYKNKYYPNATNDVIVKNRFENPYEMDTLRKITTNDKSLITTKVRISETNNYGLVYLKETEDTTKGGFIVTYLIDPIYTKIIY